MDVIVELERGREAHAKRAWTEAHDSLSLADEAAPLGPQDLELLATCAYMLGRDEEHSRGMERAHHAYVESGESLRAVRCAFWLGFTLMLRGEIGRSTGWLGRAQRLIDREELDCVERGYLLIPTMLREMNAADYEAADATAAQAAEIGQRFRDADLVAIAVHEQGYARVRQGRIPEGLALLDEAMVAVTAGELSPVVTGLVYCSVIEGCQEVYALRRAHEWTTALTRWCEQQPDMVSFTGRCLVHRSEIMQLHGAWTEALDEARRAGERFEQAGSLAGAAQALYQQGEVHRLQGDFDAAERAYTQASRRGWEPQPGLALLRLAQGADEAAANAIRRVLDEAAEPVKRARQLPAYVEIMLAIGDVPAARAACEELAEVARSLGSAMLAAVSDRATGAVELADGDPGAALAPLRRASSGFRNIEAAYDVARTGILIARARRALGDEEGAKLEFEASRATLESLGAVADLAILDCLVTGREATGDRLLTAREVQVLRLVARGSTNRSIGAELGLSERTVDRHVSNIFAKLGVSSRAAATASAYELNLL